MADIETPKPAGFEVEGIALDPDNQEFKFAVDFALESNKNLYLTGKAGSGKTTFLKYLRQVSKKEMVVVAPTGVAAINAGGQTIHSFFKIEPSLYVPGDKRLREKAPADDPDQSTIFEIFQYSRDRVKIIRSLELLVIDECCRYPPACLSEESGTFRRCTGYPDRRHLPVASRRHWRGKRYLVSFLRQ